MKPKVDGDLVYFNWSEYLDPELIKEFEKKYGVKVRQSNFDSMASMLAKLRSGNRYDVIFPDQSVTPRLVASNQLLKIDHEKLKNYDQVFEFFHDPVYDPGSAHTVPYGMYATGLIWREDKISDMTESWDDLFRGGRQGQDLRARRLPGGHRDGQLQERLRPERVRGRRARDDEADADRPEAAAARLLDATTSRTC